MNQPYERPRAEGRRTSIDSPPPDGHRLASRRLGGAATALALGLVLSACAAAAQGTSEPGEEDPGLAAGVTAATTTLAPSAEAPNEPEGDATYPVDAATPEAPENVPPAPVSEEEPPPAVGAEDVYPVRVLIPSIGVDADVIDLGLNPDRTLEVPKDFSQTGWYTGRSVPGDVGPSVVVGHVDSKSGPAVFYRLRDLEEGDTIEIHRSDGLVAYFRVSESELVDKDEFPTDAVYGSTVEPTLRLITCGGSFDRSARSYRGNLIVFAEHLGTFEPPPSGPVTG